MFKSAGLDIVEGRRQGASVWDVSGRRTADRVTGAGVFNPPHSKPGRIAARMSPIRSQGAAGRFPGLPSTFQRMGRGSTVMPVLNLKTAIQKGLWFVHFRSMIRLLLWDMRSRRNRVFFLFEGREYTYGEVYRESVRYGNYFLAQRKKRVDAGTLGSGERLTLGIYQENTPEYLFAAFGAGLSNSILFAINTGFRGDTLAAVINQARLCLLLTHADLLPEVEQALPDITVIGQEDLLLLGASTAPGIRNLDREIAENETAATVSERYRVPIDNMSPVLVIYTSGTTGMPKGVPCTHIKMVGAGAVVERALLLTKKDRGYISMPLFHSNAWYIGILTLMIAGGSFVLKRRFSASAFEEDMLAHGVTFLNYVGQPLHYIIAALEKKYGNQGEVETALARHPKNKFRVAYGNGAPAVDREKLTRYLGMKHIYEIYGSTEAVITTANMPGDPVESVGRASRSLVILDEQGRPCPPGITDRSGRLLNYDQAVGEISRKVPRDNLRFDGYFGRPEATNSKFRDGTYRSGDLGHIRIVRNRRYLYFNGRTDDWIRKDGENFSAESVLEYALRLPDVKLAIAYGAPCEVSDEKVMVAVELKPGTTFRPQETFDRFREFQETGGMDPKWMPDYIRIVDAFTLTNTQKILVRPFKKEHFNLERHPDMKVFFRKRGDGTYRELAASGYEELRKSFEATGRQMLLDPGA
jgi:fatty-acyl-CoA synthase